jgi:site-specific DNA recombinase
MSTPFNESPKRKVAIYIRVSTQEQKIDGYGLESQERRLVSYINDNKALNLVTKPEWIFTDVHTGSELQREGLQKLLRSVELKKFDAVIVWKIDRLSRSLKHLLEIFEKFKKHQVSFISIQENIDFNGPIGNLIFQIFGSIAQFERELIKTRTMAGKITSAEMGNYTGTRIPYGYEPVANKAGKGKRLQLIPEEKKVINDIFQWYVYEEMGYIQIANRLNDLKIPKGKYTKKRNKDTRWSHKHIESIIPNTLYRGKFLANRKDEYGNLLPEDQWTVVAIPACVGEFLFSLAQQKRTTRAGKVQEGNHIYLLSHKLIDVSVPERKKFYGIPRSKGGHSYRRKQYTSTEEKYYSVFEVPAEKIEDTIWEKLKFALGNTEEFIERYLKLEKFGNTHIDTLQEELTTLREKLVNTELETARIEKAYENGIYSIEKMDVKMLEATKKEGQIQNRIQQIADELQILSFKEIEIESLRKASKQVKYNLNNLSRKQKKMILDICIARVEVNRKELPSKGIQKKWLREVEVHFRFNPDLLSHGLEQGRTRKSHDKAGKSDFNGIDGVSGGRGVSGYTFFTCKFYIKKIVEKLENKVIYRTFLVEVM